MVDVSLAMMIFAGAVLLGLVLVSVALLSMGGALRRIGVLLDDLRLTLQSAREEEAREAAERLKLDGRALDLEILDRRARIDVRMQGTLRLFEERQEFKVGYLVSALGTHRVVADRIKASLVNRRDPELAWTLDATYNIPLGPDTPHVGEVTVGIKDLAKVNLPYVPEFSFLRESCRLVMSVDHDDTDGEKIHVERDLLEW